jgi:hypothetical protein
MHFIDAGPRAERGATFHERHHAFESEGGVSPFVTSITYPPARPPPYSLSVADFSPAEVFL